MHSLWKLRGFGSKTKKSYYFERVLGIDRKSKMSPYFYQNLPPPPSCPSTLSILTGWDFCKPAWLKCNTELQKCGVIISSF